MVVMEVLVCGATGPQGATGPSGAPGAKEVMVVMVQQDHKEQLVLKEQMVVMVVMVVMVQQDHKEQLDLKEQTRK